MVFYAHSGEEREDKSDWQELKLHLEETAKIAEESGKKLGLEKITYLAGLLHDLGKYNLDFQKKLYGENISVNHSAAGAKIMEEMAEKADPQQKICAEIIKYCILGHHAGLPDYSGSGGSLETRLKYFYKEEGKDLDEQWREEIHPCLDSLALPPHIITALKTSAYKGVDFSFIIRMVFSCLIDADRTNTQEFCESGKRTESVSLQDKIEEFLAAYNVRMANMAQKARQESSAANRRLNGLRNEILHHVRGKAGNSKGFYTLNVPTGGGKTLTSLGFALDHAKAHGLERIIYALPFTSIIDQTATIFKELLGEENVLEHHSNFTLPERDEERGEGEQSRQKRLKEAMEDWGMPLVLTTNVQFFESLYSARPSAARKLKNIANSIIILDEAQTVPLPLLAPCVRALDTLVRLFGCTVVFCTATQPALDEKHMTGDRKIAALPLEGKELAPNPQKLAEALRRATIKFVGEMGNDRLIAALAEESHGLIIVNSRKHAYELYEQAKKQDLNGLIHLTTRQCAFHRKQIIEDIRERLKQGKPCRIIATSLVEAGVDFDFPRVWRAEAGLDSVLQAAGRCNREGKRSREQSIVAVFKADDYAPPPEVKRQAKNLEKIAADPEFKGDLHSPEAIKAYFEKTYWEKGEDLDKKRIILEDLKFPPHFPFRIIGDKFKMIESGMEPVIIPADTIAREWIGKMAAEEISSGFLARKLQSYIVQIPPKARAKLIENGHVQFAAGHLRGNQFAVLKTASLYNKECGLLWENADYLTQEDYLS